MNLSHDSEDSRNLNAYLKNIESRISRIEEALNIKTTSDSSEEEFKLPPLIPRDIINQTDLLEDSIGQFWFAKIGIVILAIGIVLLLTFPYHNLPPAIPSIAGYALVGVLFFIAKKWSVTYQYLSHYIFGGALLLFYFSTLRLHYFGEVQAISNKSAEVILLVIVSVIFLYVSYKRQSVYLNSFGITLGVATALISGTSYSVVGILFLLSILTVFLKIKYEWNAFFVYGVILINFALFLWFLGNPLLGNKVELTRMPEFNILAFLLFGVVFSLGNLLKKKENAVGDGVIINALTNCFWSYGIFLFISIIKYKDILGVLHLFASIIFLVLSYLYWSKNGSKYSTFFYSILGYTALSVAIIAQFSKPDFFVWLSWQSVIVVSTAVLYRNKIIIVANFVMYLLIFFSYLILAGEFGIISLSFGVVALLSARILNWQKNRLDLKTDSMRVAYLGVAFFIFPYALYHIIPKEFVSLSWTVVAIIYYILSVILKNKKYRWMALLTFFLTVIYVLFVGTTNLDPSYRIVSFFFLGIVLVAISIYYVKIKSKNTKPEAENNSSSKTTLNNNS
jgi:hypothetical protein